jgi:small subunit ribosomal protein S6
MSKVKQSGNPRYELLYIISNEFSEDEVKPIALKVNNFIKEGGGEIVRAEEWGKKRLAYQIKKFNYGYYNLVEFILPGANLAKLERSIRLANDVLRHQIVRKDPRKAVKPRVIREVEAVKPVKEEKSEKEKLTDLKDLDEKLDRILETSDLL